MLDTNIVSFIFKGDTRINDYKPYLKDQRLAISFMTVAELFQWAMVRKWGSRRIKKMETAMKSYLVLPFDIEVCRLWGEVRAECQSAGRPISPQDAWIGATALQHDLPLVTHNPSDFEAVEDLEIITTLSR
ncbi:PIN domain-containing protein [Desulfonema limicola]|uniref:PIN domain-containing protein n=1 Tax=Desulfonema limicola TaxID=45656 RepID=A0A975B6P5_9BACT|nr:PIN domain-containing protein [Desulfonema limicola]